MTPPSVIRREAGFSLLEAIIALVIASMVLSVVLPIASRAVSDNLRIGMRGLDAFALSIEEQSFRDLALVAAPAPTLPGGEPAFEMLEGNAGSMATHVSAERATLCAPAGFSAPVRLEIEQQGGVGRLRCLSGELDREIMRWSDATAAFAYSLDGLRWSTTWPPDGKPRRSGGLDGSAGDVMIEAPKVRFTLTRGNDILVSWIAAFGTPRPVEYLLEDVPRTPVAP